MRLVRTLPTNPDVTRCAVDSERVYYLNPPLGIAAYIRNPESDPVMELVYAPAPTGAGLLAVSDFQLADLASGMQLRVWEEGGQAYLVDPGRPDRAAATDGSASILPLGGDAVGPAHASPLVIVPAAESAPVQSMGEAADDPAILVGDADAVWIVGTNKRSGLHVYDLSGRELHRIDRGRLNNVEATPLVRNGRSQGRQVWLRIGDCMPLAQSEHGMSAQELLDTYRLVDYGDLGDMEGDPQLERVLRRQP